MASKVKQLIDEFFPGFSNDQIVVGLTNVGICVVNCTLSVNTAQTDAQIIAAPPNTAAAGAPCGSIVHSFGVAPSLVIIQQKACAPTQTSLYTLDWMYVTADNSAVYVRAQSWTGGPKGMYVQMIAVR